MPKVGFAALKKQIAAKSGAPKKRGTGKRKVVKDPGAVAAAIGRKKLGQAEMTRRSVAGRKKAAKKK